MKKTWKELVIIHSSYAKWIDLFASVEALSGWSYAVQTEPLP